MPAKSPIQISVDRLVPQPGATMTKNAYGIDVLPRPYSCPRARVSSLIPKAGTPDIFYSNLRATGNYSVTESEGLICTVTIEYKGLLNNAIPDPLISTGMSSGSTSATKSDTGDATSQRTWEIVFYSPTQTFRYVSNGRPRSPRFSSYEGGPVAGPSIMTQSITDGNGRRRTSAPGITLIPRAELSAFSTIPVPGTPYYECEETWRGVYLLRTT